jgi:hypothetical protein
MRKIKIDRGHEMALFIDLSTQNYSMDLARLLAKAAAINHYYEEQFDLSFSSMMLASLACDDPISRWLQAYVKDARINVSKILDEHNINRQILDDIAACDSPKEPLKAGYTMTTSASRFLKTASQLNERLNREYEIKPGMKPLDVRHLIAVYIYAPGGHERDILRWGFDRMNWSIAFLLQMGSMHTDEFGFWAELHKDIFKKEPELPDIEK